MGSARGSHPLARGHSEWLALKSSGLMPGFVLLAPHLGAIGGAVLVMAGLAQGHHVGLRVAMQLKGVAALKIDDIP